MKKFLLLLSIITGFLANGQVYNNEWIDYNKTYYKFKVGATGLYRITHADLATMGIAGVPAEHFQLWRNGKEVPLYTSITGGPLTAGAYIEFWGERNDGKADNSIYLRPEYQLNDKFSLQTDTAAFFLTVNPTGNNLRLSNTVNNVAGNILPKDEFFMHTEGKYYRDKLHWGLAVNVGEYLYSSSYDKGEGWTSNDLGASGFLTYTHNNLHVFPGGPDATIKYAAAGNSIYPRKVGLRINNVVIDTMQEMNFFNLATPSFTVPLNVLSSNVADVSFDNITNFSNDRLVVAQAELTYPRIFNFGGAANFSFKLAANTSGNYLEINNFNYGTVAPVLYDLTNGKRYVADINAAPVLRFALEPSATDRNLILVSQEPSNFNAISTGFQVRNFINYAQASRQGDYMIISNSLLMQGAANPVEAYRQYRSSSAGGGYSARIYDIHELIDQFAFGIKMHPLAVRNFAMYARNTFTTIPRFIFLIGKAVTYNQYRGAESNPDMDRLNLVPTFGNPASDNMLTSSPGTHQPLIAIGRIGAISAAEVSAYLEKVKDYEQAQAIASPVIADKGWMKNVVHIVGASETNLQTILETYMSKYRTMIQDTLFGANVYTFSKTSADAVQQLNTVQISKLFQEGISMITYFGHSSATTLEFNLDKPESYNNKGKYPIFFALGCNVGNFYNFSSQRFTNKETLSEKFILTPDKGAIAFVASSHFGIVHYLDIFNTRNYNNLRRNYYDKSLGENLMETIRNVFQLTTEGDYYSRVHSEELILHGDPAISLNTHAKPDYAVEEPMVKVNPAFVSIAETSFKVDASFINLGRAVSDSIVVETKRLYPNQTTAVIHRDTIPGIRYKDSVSVVIPIDPIKDKGLNKITVTIDADNKVDELYETNNSITKDIFIYEEDVRPVYPYKYAIVNKQGVKLVASTANPLSESKQYLLELDTTALFNSSFKKTQTKTSKGGVLEFEPGFTFTDNTVYYWRVAIAVSSGVPNWHSSSFVYLANSEPGFNQSHFYQHTESNYNQLKLDSIQRQLFYLDRQNDIFIKSGVFPTSFVQANGFSVSINGDPYIRSVCGVSNIVFNVFDQKTFKAWYNGPAGSVGKYGSDPVCGADRSWNFQFNILDTNKRRKIVEFMDLIPDGDYVIVRNSSGTTQGSNTYPSDWINDQSFLGQGNSIYHRMIAQGFTEIDSFNRPRAWVLVYKKNSQQYTPKYIFSDGIYDPIILDVSATSSNNKGMISSPLFGPAKAWKNLLWEGDESGNINGDEPVVNIIGIDNAGNESILINGLNLSQKNMDISSISASQFPFLKVTMDNIDTVNYSPYQLKYWRLTYDPVPEGAVAPNYAFEMRDSLEVGEPLKFKVAFKNVSQSPMDSLKVKIVVTDQNNVPHSLPIIKQKPLVPGDSLHLTYNIDTKNYSGKNTLFVEFNPDNDQPEQYHFNNFFYKDFRISRDSLSPVLDVTFDGVHILNRDIVSSKPRILIRLQDEARFLRLDDTALVSLQVRYPNGTTRPFYFNNDSLKYTPAAPGGDNVASIEFTPAFLQDGDYELIVSGKDKADNMAGGISYRVGFQVINKPMISNMLNYPNPFTSSTAFVFTLTGSEVPQNIKIQIMTVTGKIVREITKEELGPIHIGRNITEFKWDGTDQYGQKLANGIYLYRVVTNLNGKLLDKYKPEGDKTDQYFNKGYGKMYLMR